MQGKHRSFCYCIGAAFHFFSKSGRKKKSVNLGTLKIVEKVFSSTF